MEGLELILGMGGNHKVLITGGLGNLGSWLTEHFLNQGYEVWVMAKNHRKLATDLAYKFIQCDITDYQECQRSLQKHEFEFVIHAASVNDGFVEGYFQLANQVNVLGTRNLLEALRDKGVSHFLYFSTFQVYGKYSGIINESTVPEPKNDYGATHLFAEYHIRQFHINTGLPFTIIRLSNSYGCPKDYNSSKWYLILNDLSRSAFQDQKIVLKSNGQAQRDFIWMGTVAHVVHQLIERPAENEVYNLSGEQTFNMVEIAKMVQNAYRIKFGRDVEVLINEKDKTQHPQDLMVSSQKLRSLIELDDRVMFEKEAANIFDFLEKEINR